MTNGTTNPNLLRGQRCANACGTVESLKDMFVAVADEKAPTPEELAKAICSDCAHHRGTLGRVRAGNLAAFRPAPKPAPVREERPAVVTQKADPKPPAYLGTAARFPDRKEPFRSRPEQKPRRQAKPKRAPKPVAKGGLSYWARHDATRRVIARQDERLADMVMLDKSKKK